MNVWQFLSGEPGWFKIFVALCLLLIIWLIVRKDIKTKWFSAQKHNRRQGPRPVPRVKNGPDRRKKK